MADRQSRKYQLTINNPAENGLDHEQIKLLLERQKGIVYFCMADEKGLEEQTPHTHVYIHFTSAVRFSHIKKLFPAAHIESVRGTAEENRAYVQKSGKWENDKKGDTRIDGTFFDEFRSSLPIGDMLNYLDGYPVTLPARYANRVACFVTVYIICDIDLKHQYTNVQCGEPETWRAFLRRIHKVVEYRADGESPSNSAPPGTRQPRTRTAGSAPSAAID